MPPATILRPQAPVLLVSCLLLLIADPSMGLQHGEVPKASPTLRVQVTLVNLTVTVVDQRGSPVAGLQKKDFALYEDGIRQDIAFFRNSENTPVSVGIVLDTSGSMVGKTQEVRGAIVHFAEAIDPEDDVFVMQFSAVPALVQDFTGDRRTLVKSVARLSADGSTSLYDAIVSGLQHLRKATVRRKALFLITDGNDTSSQIDPQRAVDFAVSSEIPIYCLGIGRARSGGFDRRAHVLLSHAHDAFRDTVDMDVLRTFSNLTGGRTFLVERPRPRNGVDGIDQACGQVAAELRHQYILGYYPSNSQKAREYRRIKVKVNNPKLQVRARDGYFILPPSDGAPGQR